MEAKKLLWWKALALSVVGALKLASNADAQEARPVENPLQPIKQEAPIEVSSKTDFFSKYVYRGMKFSDKSVVQENLKASYKGLTFLGFGNYDTESRKVNEEDLIIDYTTPINDKISLSLGYGVFTFPNTDFKKTQEVYAAFSLENEKCLNPSIALVHDFKEGKGNYLEAAVSKEFNVWNTILLTKAKLAYNDHYYRENSGFSHLELSLSNPINLSKNTSIVPSINLSKAIDKKDFDDEFYWGIGLEHKF